MVQGIGITPEEKEYIIHHKNTKFPSQIAQELSDNFAVVNGGYRGKDTIKKVIRDSEDQDE